MRRRPPSGGGSGIDLNNHLDWPGRMEPPLCRDSSTRDSVNEPQTLRSDARRNREKLLAVAAEAFASSGVNASLEEIARQAGVGVGTLYRHFPSREALVAATYRHEVEQLCDSVGDLQASLAPDAALRAWMDGFVHYTAAKRGMGRRCRPSWRPTRRSTPMPTRSSSARSTRCWPRRPRPARSAPTFAART